MIRNFILFYFIYLFIYFFLWIDDKVLSQSSWRRNCSYGKREGVWQSSCQRLECEKVFDKGLFWQLLHKVAGEEMVHLLFCPPLIQRKATLSLSSLLSFFSFKAYAHSVLPWWRLRLVVRGVAREKLSAICGLRSVLEQSGEAAWLNEGAKSTVMAEREHGRRQWNVGSSIGNKIWVESGFELVIQSENSPSIVFKFGI